MKQLSIGARVRHLRENLGITQEKLGQTIGMSRGNISKIEKDILEPSNAFLNALKDRFAVNPEWIISGEGEMHVSPEHYLRNGIEVLGKEKMAAGIARLLESEEYSEMKEFVGLTAMVGSCVQEEVADYLRYIVATWSQGDEKTRHWLEKQLELAFKEVKK